MHAADGAVLLRVHCWKTIEELCTVLRVHCRKTLEELCFVSLLLWNDGCRLFK
ncbi:hypothetical protein IC582_015276 [Cucumis melo]